MKKLLLLSAMLLLATSYAAELGDAAPEIKVSKWVKGEPVKVTGDDKIYVVEFWATWCPPCRTSIPHLTGLQKRFADKNVVIIGVTDEKEGVVQKFVKEQGGKMDYRVVIDENGATSKGYMEAFEIGGIPHAFIVQNKKILWHGHPMDGLDITLEQVVSGKYNLTATKKKQKAEALLETFSAAVASGDDIEADKIALEIQAAEKEGLFAEKLDLKAMRKETKTMVLRNQFMRASFQADEKAEAEAGKKLQELDPSINLDDLRNEVAGHKVANSYFQAASKGDKDEANKHSAELAARMKGNSKMANEVAWTILTNEGIKFRDTELALRIAKQACQDSKWAEAGLLDTYARALFDTGKKEEAVAAQQKAVEKASGDEKAQLETTLAAYKSGKLPAAE